MPSSKNKRLAKNTIILYIRMIFLMAVSLYTSRVVLNALGIDDYGVYSAVGGFVALFGIVSSSLSSAISRFLTFELGKNRFEKLKLIFSSAVLIQIIMGLGILLLIETLGVWFLNTKMTIPNGQMGAANWVLQFSAITFVVNIISVPYTAVIIAHEKMSAFAYISIFEALGKLGIAFLIMCSSVNRLVTYALLLCILSIIIRAIYNIYCRRNFEECKFKLTYEKGITKEIFSFAGWNFIGASSGLLKDQGINLLLNVFCGPVVNAARGIAMQVSNAIHSFINSFTTALNPQITKEYAQGNYKGWTSLVFRGTRFSCYLLLLPALPIFLETPQLLIWWLKIVPEYANIFVRLIIIYVFVETLSVTLITLMLSTGKIRNYQLIVGGCQLLNFPIAYILLWLKFPPQSTIVGTIVIGMICLMLRLLMLKRMVRLNVGEYIKGVLLNVILVCLTSAIIPLALNIWMPQSLIRILIVIISSLIFTSLSIVFIGCNSSEREMILSQITKRLKRTHAYK